MLTFVRHAFPISVSLRASLAPNVSHKGSFRPFTVRPQRSVTMSNEQATTKFKLALCQMPVTANKETNINTARDFLRRAKAAKASLAILPECFNCPYDTSCFSEYAERMPEPGTKDEGSTASSPTVAMLQDAAKEMGLYIVGGSIPEVDSEQRLYNSSLSFAPDGTILAKHRKAHLFDINVPGRIKFTESEVLSAGNRPTTFNAKGLGTTIGVSICYDVRFPEMAAVMSTGLGAQLIVIPGAFNMTTGPAHWELLLRARALDNQVFVAACSPARNEDGDGYKAWGHSLLVDPWGTIIASADEKPDIVTSEVDMSRLLDIRASIPLRKQKRPDVYDLRRVFESGKKI